MNARILMSLEQQTSKLSSDGTTEIIENDDDINKNKLELKISLLTNQLNKSATDKKFLENKISNLEIKIMELSTITDQFNKILRE